MAETIKNKKGFTLVELIVTIAIMAIIAGIAVPSVSYSVNRRQRTTAESDCQEVYRMALSCVSDLARNYFTPNHPDGTGSNDNTAVGGWNTAYSARLVRQLYITIGVVDIKLVYYSPPTAESPNTLIVPEGSSFSDRASGFSGKNKNPYIVVQVKKENVAEDDAPPKLEYYMYISYHNDNYPFKPVNEENFNAAEKGFNAYTTNQDNPIFYKSRIRID